MICKNCGNELREGSKFCGKCGAAVSEQAENQPQQHAYQQPVYQQPVYQQPMNHRNPNDGRGYSIAALVLGICGVVLSWVSVLNLFVLAAGILGVIYGYKGRQMSMDAYGKPSGLATAGFVLGIIGTSICGIGVLSCIACAAASNCYSCAVADLLYSF